jgi:alkyl hydroperoxide reductase subunit AhpF
MNTEVREFIGKNRLEGVRVLSSDGENRYDLQADGVFLEIGLVPNTDPVKELVSLNSIGEIIAERNQSTSQPGFFAAGDVTDEPRKQIIVAAGDGARAALEADQYLRELDFLFSHKEEKL